MTEPHRELTHRPDDAELRDALEVALAAAIGTSARIARLERRVSEYGSSFALEELDVTLADGAALPLIFKDVSWRGLSGAAQAAKPGFLYDPLREIACYRVVLPEGPPGPPAFRGALCDPARDRFWLFVERVAGAELYQVGDLEAWLYVARWLAGLHQHFLGRRAWLLAQAPLVSYEHDYYERWANRAAAFTADAALGPDVRARLLRLFAGYGRAVERLTALPATLLHGDCYASNVLVARTDAGLRVCPVDWEMAAVGPGLVDLAAFTAGKWTEGERRSLAQAYYEALPAGAPYGGRADFLESLDWCRLHLAVQWLGWSETWSPPPAQAHNWLGEALALAARLGF